MDIPPKLNKYLFLSLFLILIITSFSRNGFRGVDDIAPEVLKEPLQAKIGFPQDIRFAKDGYEYNLTPLYDYEISGLVVGKWDYRWFSTYKYDSVFPVDLCLIWGSNIASKVYKNNAVKFSQDCRWCYVNWVGKVDFNLQELANSHLLVNSNKIMAKINNLARGDQIRIKGKLVNAIINPTGKAGASSITWNTSISRTDSGAGACEVIYVEDIRVLREANVVSRILFRISSYGLLLLIAWNIFRFFMPERVS